MNIGEVLRADMSCCLVRMFEKRPVTPEIGSLISLGNKAAMIESYVYGDDGALLAKAVLISQNDPWQPPVKPGLVVKSTLKLRIEEGSPKIFAGFVRSGNKYSPFYLDANYLLGPEGAHVNASGISGLATKTSYLMTLIWSIMRQAAAGVLPVVSFIINLKHQDLMYLDRPSRINGISTLEPSEAEPFGNVTYFAPKGSPSFGRADVKPFGYTIETGLKSLRNLVAGLPDPNQTLAALSERLIKARSSSPGEFAGFNTWEAIWTEPPLVMDGFRPNSWEHFALGTVRRFVRHVQHVVGNENTGLFRDNCQHLSTMGDIVAQAMPGKTIVIDFSTMTPTEQYFCMSELLGEIYADVNSPARKLPRHVVLYVDEMNRYGGKGGTPHPIRDLLLEVSERGRSIGLSLISAQQFASHVHPRLVGNAATRVVGRLTKDESYRQEYRFLSASQREWLQFLPKGELLVYHSPVGQSLKVMFPHPPFHLGEFE